MDIVIYCDGACSANGSEKNFGGYAAIISSNRGERVVTGAVQNTTNQKMELQAAILGFRVINSMYGPCNVTIVSDSQYVICGMRDWSPNWQKNNWTNAGGKPVANKDLWLQLLEESSKHSVTYKWVRGHSDCIENERCDKLAVEAREKLEKEIINE